jgi:hypothetical protein
VKPEVRDPGERPTELDTAGTDSDAGADSSTVEVAAAERSLLGSMDLPGMDGNEELE